MQRIKTIGTHLGGIEYINHRSQFPTITDTQLAQPILSEINIPIQWNSMRHKLTTQTKPKRKRTQIHNHLQRFRIGIEVDAINNAVFPDTQMEVFNQFDMQSAEVGFLIRENLVLRKPQS